jgi:hypothetical protein
VVRSLVAGCGGTLRARNRGRDVELQVRLPRRR